MQLSVGTLSPDYKREIAILPSKFHWGGLAILFISLVLFPILPIASNYLLWVVVDFSITIIAVIGLNILTGYCGQGSIAQAAFMAVGSYSSMILTGELGLPFWVALPISGLSAGVLGTIFGLSSLKVKGLYLFLITLGAHFIIEYTIVHLPKITGGIAGIAVSPPEFGGFVFKSLKSYYYIVMLVLILAIFVGRNLMRTHIGRCWLSIRDKEIVTRSMGINVYRFKLLAFFVGCAYAGIAGSLWAHSKSWLSPEDFSLMQACWFLGIIIVGGIGTISGSIFGTIFLMGLGEITRVVGPAVGKLIPSLSMGVFASSAQLIYSAVIILFLVFEPGGLVNLGHRLKMRYGKWFVAFQATGASNKQERSSTESMRSF